MPLTRDDIAAHIRGAFIGGAASRVDLLDLARADRAAPEVLQTLRALPDRRYGHLHEVWDDLPQVPVGPRTEPATPAALAG